MATISEMIARWIEKTEYSHLSDEAVDIAKRNILDFIGTTLAGSRQPVAHVLDRYLHEMAGSEQATVVGLAMKASCVDAAMVNGTMGHYLDYDDLVIPMAGAGGPHITAAVLPSALAIAEKTRSSGRQLIEAYVLGCELTYRIGRSVDPTHYNSGWHTTGTEGIFGATAAACKLLGASAEEIAHALGIAGSEASGLRENFGTMTKPFHAGQASAKGLRAALLAQCGFTSSKTIFEGKDGFCRIFSKDPKKDEITKDLDQFNCLPQIRLKLYPCCAASHSAIYATLKLAKEHDLKVHEVESIDVKGDPQMAVVLIYENPQNAMEGKFSVQYPLALAIAEKRVILADFTDKKMKERAIGELMSKIRLIPVSELRCKDAHSRASIVEINLKGGSQLVNRCDYPPGTPENPISGEDILEKYRSCAGLVLKERDIQESISMIMSLESVDNIENLTRLISGR